MQEGGNEPITHESKRQKGLFFWLRGVLAVLILVSLLIILLIHFPPVQRWGLNQLTSSMSERLSTRVTIGRFSLHPVSDLILHDVYIGSTDHPDDTLIHAVTLHVDYRRIWDVLARRATITQIGIRDGLLNIHRIAGDSLTNLDLALQRLLPPKDPNKPDFVLDLKTLNAQHLDVRVDDETNGTLMNLFFSRADVELHQINIQGKFISVRDLDLDEPDIRVINRLPMADSATSAPGSEKPWSFDVTSLRLTDGRFLIDNKTKAKAYYPYTRGIDYAHMVLEDLDIQMDSLIIRGWDFKGSDIHIHLLHENGFEINQLAADKASVSADGIRIDQLQIKTADSDIRNSIALLYSGFRDFKSFADSVKIDIPAADMRLRVRDLLSLAPGLQNVAFLSDNADKDIALTGRVNGVINRLRIQGMDGAFGPLSMKGDFRSRDLAVKGSQLLSLDLEKSAFSAAGLKSIFPKMNVPPIFNRFGKVNFVGKYDGYPDDFVAFGTFHTALGAVALDMNLNIVEGIAEGEYTGSIGMTDFDLGALTGNQDLGRVSMSGRVIEGRGLTSESVFADLTAQVSSLTFKGYEYRYARVDGLFAGKQFNGTLDINDPNMDMHFEGKVDLRDSLPRLDFISRVDSIDLWALGLTKKPVSIEGIFDVDMTVGQVNAVHGAFYGDKLRLTVNDKEYLLDSLHVLANIDSVSQQRSYIIASDALSGTVKGEFNPELLPNQLHHYLSRHYPSSIDPPSRPLVPAQYQNMEWNLKITDSKTWFDLLNLESLRVKNALTSGALDLSLQESSGSLMLPELHYNGINAYGTSIYFEERAGLTEVDMELVAADLRENFFFEDVLISGSATDDSVRLNFQTDHLADVIDELDLDIEADPEGGIWNIAFNPRRLVMLGADWKVPEGNRVEIRKGSFNLENFELVSADQRIIVDDIDQKGITAYISGFDISYLNELWINDKFEFAGLYTMDVEIDNLYDIRQMRSVLSIPALQINSEPYGQWVIKASMEEPKDSVRIDIAMQNSETKLIGEGAYLPPLKSIPKDAQNYLRLGLQATEFPLDFLEFLLGGNIRDTEGSVDMTLSLAGKTNKLDPNGQGIVYNGSTVIDYLGAAYSFHNQKFTITETMIDLSGTRLYDVLGNYALVEGGITHRYLRNLGLNATITSDKILGLDVSQEENNVFYGRGIGSVFARFSGSVANPVMRIQTTTAKGTHLYIPLSGAASGTDGDFVVFLENGRLPVTKPTQINLGGINLTMNMTVTDDAIVEIVFDENTGEVLRGRGQGDLQLSMTRTGQFSMFGNYVISEGDYLFTNFRIVRKPFDLVPGGRIQWSGDPYNANLNVEAKYAKLEAPVYALIEEYLADLQDRNDLIEQARTRTPVDLTMKLTGSLLQPNIAFDITFPDLVGEIKGYTDSKINTLKANENEMLTQVVGLLLTRSFFPPGAGIGTALSSSLVDNTLGELLSSTLSSLFSGILSNLFPEGGAFTGIDFQLNLDLPGATGSIVDPGGNLNDESGTDVEIEQTFEFFNDRLTINIGGNYVSSAFVPDGYYFAGDVAFAYDLTPDKRLKLRAYNLNTMTVEGRKNKIGVGLAYRREYDNFADFLGRKKKKELE